MQPRATLGMPWDGNPRCPEGAAGCCPRTSRAGVPGYRGYRGCRQRMFRGNREMSPRNVPRRRGRAPGCRGIGAQGCRGWSPGPYLLPTSPPCRARVVAGSSSIGFRLLLCFQLFLQLPRDEAEQRGQLAVGPQVLELEAAAAERARGAGPARAVAEDAAPAEAVAAAREPHGLREELQAAGALQLQDALQLLHLDDGGHGWPGAERSARRVSLSPGACSGAGTPRAVPVRPRCVLCCWFTGGCIFSFPF